MYPIVFRAGRPQQEFANGFIFLAGEGAEEEDAPDQPGFAYAFKNRTTEEPRILNSRFLRFRKT